MFLVVRPLMARRVRETRASGHVGAILVGLILSALATDWIGIHAIFGAFLFGVVLPGDSAAARVLVRRLERPVTMLLLPAFFAFTGMRTEIGLLAGWSTWLLCALTIVVATAGKFGGTLIAARLTGMNWRHAASLGVLMNTRGLMELIVLNVGLDLHVISPLMFTIMVLMAVTTTLATTPALAAFESALPLQRDRLSEELL
jgi:Kef-type K+ transport system membrane component KefB